MRVDKLAKTFPEAKERRRKWFPLREAAEMVAEPELDDPNFDHTVVVLPPPVMR